MNCSIQYSKTHYPFQEATKNLETETTFLNFFFKYPGFHSIGPIKSLSTIADNINKNPANETFIVSGEGISRNEETFREGLIVMAGGE